MTTLFNHNDKIAAILEPFYTVAGTGSSGFSDLETFKGLCAWMEAKHDQIPNLLMMSGMATGWDAAVAKAAIDVSVPFCAIVPNRTYGSYYWGRVLVDKGKPSRHNEFNDLLRKAEFVEYVAEDVYGVKNIYVMMDGRKVHSNFARNQRMVDLAQAFICYYTEGAKGTKDCLWRIQRARKPIKHFGDSPYPESNKREARVWAAKERNS